jgi:hypothetical protein
MHARLALIVLMLASGMSAAQDAPNITGVWTLDRGSSDDITAKIKEAAGPEYMSGGPGLTRGVETWIPWTGSGEAKRVGLREFLLSTVPALQTVEIQQGAAEVTTIHGESGVRIFNLTRESAGTSAASGERVTRRAHWQGHELSLESKGKEGKLTEALAFDPAAGQLKYTLRLEHKQLKAPLELRLLYTRSQAR